MFLATVIMSVGVSTWIIIGEKSIEPNLSALREKQNLTFSGSVVLANEGGSPYDTANNKLHEGDISTIASSGTLTDPNGAVVTGKWVFTSNRAETSTFSFTTTSLNSLAQVPSTTALSSKYQTLGDISVTFIPDNIADYNECTATISGQSIFPVARIGTTAYGSIEKALDVVSENTVYVLPGANAVIRRNISVPANSTLALHTDDDDAMYECGKNDDYRKGNGKVIFSDRYESTYLKNLVTIDSGVRLTVYGTLNIGGILGRTTASGVQGHSSDVYSQITLNDYARLILSNGTIDCLGFIKESYDNNKSEIILNSGNMYAPFVVYDYRGGNHTVSAYKNPDNKVFPFRMFDMPNIRPKTVCYKDATIIGYVDLYTNEVNKRVLGQQIYVPAQHNLATIDIFGASDCIVNTEERIEIKYNYDSVNYGKASAGIYNIGSTVDIDMYGGGANGYITMPVSIIGKTATVTTQDVLFPLCWKYQISLHNGSYSIKYPMKFMSGSSITIDDNASFELVESVIFYPSSTRTNPGTADPTTIDDGVFYDAISSAGYPAKDAARCIVNGEMTIKKEFGGYIETQSPNGLLAIESDVSNGMSSVEGTGNTLSTTDMGKLFIDTSAEAGTITLYEKIFAKAQGDVLVKNSDTNVDEITSKADLGTNFYESTGSAWKIINNPQTYTVNLHYDNDYSGQNDAPNRSYRVLLRDVTSVAVSELEIGEPPELKYYRFDGWYTDPDCTQHMDDSGEVVNITTPATLYAKWTPIMYTLEFMLSQNDGESFETITTEYPSISFTIDGKNEKFIYNGTTNDKIDFVVKDYGEYRFFGWYRDLSNLSATTSLTFDQFENIISGTDSTKIIYFALLRQVYTITLSGGSGFDDVTFGANEITSINVPKNMSLKDSGEQLPTISSIDNNTEKQSYFTGVWYSDSDRKTVFDINQPINDNIIIYAGWDTKVGITYKRKDNVAIVTDYYKPNTTMILRAGASDYRVDAGASDDYTATNWSFAGKWSLGDAGASYTITQNVETIGEFNSEKIFTITVTLSGNGTTVTVDGTKYTSGGSQEIFESEAKNITITASTANDKLETFTIGGAGGDINGKTGTWTGDISSDITVNAVGKNNSCIAAGTLITLADGTQKAVEDVTESDVLLVFNHFTGEYEPAHILFLERGEYGYYNVINLEFSDGTATKLIYEHALFDLTLNKYVYVTEQNYSEFVGHEFALSAESGYKRVTLIKASLDEEYTAPYSITTVYHFNYFIDGLFSLPGAIDGLFNYFEYADNLQYDEEKMLADIEKYGLYTYEDFAEHFSYEIFEYCIPVKYLKVAVGKGMITYEELIELFNKYASDLIT